MFVDGDLAVGADDLVAAEQEAERDQQTAGRDERDHVGHTGHQHAAGAGTPRLAGAAAAVPSPAVTAPSTRGAFGSSA